MARYSAAEWRPVVNHSGRVNAHLGLVIHVQEGNNSTFDQDNNPASQVSNHFWAGKAGELEQMVDTDDIAWTEMAGNGYYTSVETEGFATEPLTSSQVATLGQLYAWGHQVHGWPLRTCDHGESGLTTHAHYPSGMPDESWGGHPCPGPLRSAQLPYILTAAGLAKTSTTPDRQPVVRLPAATLADPLPATAQEIVMVYLIEATGADAKGGHLDHDGAKAGTFYVLDLAAKVKRTITSEAELALYKRFIPAANHATETCERLAATPTA